MTDSILPELVAPTKARKIRASKHDFRNGEGKVFAHRHSNGGGWVADTASVAESVRVAAGCGVYGYARVTDNVTLSGRATIGDYARVMHNVALSGSAVVRGSAILRDSVSLTEKAHISGSAYLSGNTNSRGGVYISDFAVLHNVRLVGPHRKIALQVSGTAKVFDSRLSGATWISNSAIVQNAEVGSTWCFGNGKIIDSTVSTTTTNHVSQYLWAPRRGQQVEEPPDATLFAFESHVIRVRGLVLNSRCYMRPTIVTPQTYLISCQFLFWNQSFSDTFTEFPAGPVVDLTTNRVEELSNYYLNRQTAAAGWPGTATTTGAPVIASVGAVPPMETRQRRIMRMEGVDT